MQRKLFNLNFLILVFLFSTSLMASNIDPAISRISVNLLYPPGGTDTAETYENGNQQTALKIRYYLKNGVDKDLKNEVDKGSASALFEQTTFFQNQSEKTIFGKGDTLADKKFINNVYITLQHNDYKHGIFKKNMTYEESNNPTIPSYESLDNSDYVNVDYVDVDYVDVDYVDVIAYFMAEQNDSYEVCARIGSVSSCTTAREDKADIKAIPRIRYLPSDFSRSGVKYNWEKEGGGMYTAAGTRYRVIKKSKDTPKIVKMTITPHGNAHDDWHESDDDLNDRTVCSDLEYLFPDVPLSYNCQWTTEANAIPKAGAHEYYIIAVDYDADLSSNKKSVTISPDDYLYTWSYGHIGPEKSYKGDIKLTVTDEYGNVSTMLYELCFADACNADEPPKQ